MFVDVHTVLGRMLLTWLETQIEQKRRSMEKPLHDHDSTQFLRGQLKALRSIHEVILAPGIPQNITEVGTLLQEHRTRTGVDQDKKPIRVEDL